MKCDLKVRILSERGWVNRVRFSAPEALPLQVLGPRFRVDEF